MSTTAPGWKKTENLVRVDARRLRTYLANYYAGPGADDPVRIHMDKGGYAPRFEHVVEEPPVATRKVANRRSIGLVVFIAGFIAVSGWIYFDREQPRPRLPGVLDGGTRGHSQQVGSVVAGRQPDRTGPRPAFAAVRWYPASTWSPECSGRRSRWMHITRVVSAVHRSRWRPCTCCHPGTRPDSSTWMKRGVSPRRR